MNRVSVASTATPPTAEQSISATFHVEVMNDLETGEPMLIASTYANQGDLQVVTAEQVRRKATEVRAVIAKGEALAAAFEAATSTPAEMHPTQTATDIETGGPLTFTCMTGCDQRHRRDLDTPSFARDISCIDYDTENTAGLRVYCGDDDDPAPVLSTLIQVDHFHPDSERAVPYAVVEVISDHFTGALDPDGLAAVIDHFEQRVAAMRLRHAELIRARDEYTGRQA